jgi:hypothetical protein
VGRANGDRNSVGYTAADEDGFLGRRRWTIAEGYIPGWSDGPEPQFTSHETACPLNANDEEADVEITIYFEDREPAGSYRVAMPARRTRHVRFNELTDPEPVPTDTDYASVISSDVIEHPVSAFHSGASRPYPRKLLTKPLRHANHHRVLGC